MARRAYSRTSQKSRGRLLSLTIDRFKSFAERCEIELAPLTVLVGRNNSGKSSLIQGLLLLKQTLAEPRPDVPLHLDGAVSALNLRELTHGWPEPSSGRDGTIEGPTLSVCWESDIDLALAREDARYPDLANLAKHTGLAWLNDGSLEGDTLRRRSKIEVFTCEEQGTTSIARINLSSEDSVDGPLFELWEEQGNLNCYWYDYENPCLIDVELDHFIPYLSIDRDSLGPRDRQRTWYNAYVFLLAQPLETLKRLLGGFQYLSSTRSLPPSLYRASNVPPQELGVSGEFAAQLLHRRQHEVVHYLPPLEVDGDAVAIPPAVQERPLVAAVNDVLTGLSIRAPLSVEEIREVGFRLLFGGASLAHVGRGLTYLLPLVELGLFADPVRFQAVGDELTRAEYAQQCPDFAHIAFEEPEAHLHPKVQSRLAHWMVSLALAQRNLIVETHSDHLVRRLRGLVARAGRGSELEAWLLENVIVLEVEQDHAGRSTVNPSRLTADGGIGERWPADFMDEASTEDSAIYYAGMAKQPAAESPVPEPLVIHDQGPEPEVGRVDRY